MCKKCGPGRGQGRGNRGYRLKMELPARFWAKVAAGPTCWVWKAAKYPSGYGAFFFNGKVQGAHRVAYTALVGEIPEGLDIDHLCRNRACVNPAHMEAVTRQINVKRGLQGRSQMKEKCPRNHTLRGENVGTSPKGHRYCKVCKRERMADPSKTSERSHYQRDYYENNKDRIRVRHSKEYFLRKSRKG